MNKWFIKKICTASKDNPSFPEAEQVIIYGKGQNILLNKVIKDVNNYSQWIPQKDDTLNSDKMLNYGYCSKGIAETILAKSLKRDIESDRFWEFVYKIVSYNVDNLEEGELNE